MSPRARRFVPPPAPKTPKSIATRQRLLEVASCLFMERGYHAVSLQDIAEQAALTKGGLYGHFRSKGQLLVEVIRWKLADDDIEQLVHDATADDRKAKAFMRGVTDLGRLEIDAAAAARDDPELAAGLGALYTERQSTLRTAMNDVVADPETAAWLISTLWAGIHVREVLAVPQPSPDKLLSALRRLVIDEAG